jgi:hypothetical protein
MGFRCRWLATQGRGRDEVLARLHLKITGELVEPVYDTGLYALEVGDWLVVIGDGADHMGQIKRAQAAQLSDGGDVVYLVTDDTTMTFEVAMFREGEQRWSIAYDGRDGVTTPTSQGKVPLDARVLEARLEKEQGKAGGPKAEVDHLYELGPAYAMQLTGFRHDQTLGSGEHVPVWTLAVKRSK